MNFWIESSDEDYETMMVLYEKNKNSWCLFVGHIVIEKLLKAFYAKRNRLMPYAPKSHDLLYLAEKIGIVLSDDEEKILSKISEFNLNARYDDYKNNFKNQCTKEYTLKQINNIKEVREWLVNIMIV